MVEVRALNKQHPLYREDLNNVLNIPDIEFLKGKVILITGASGLIGLCLIDALMLYNKKGAGIIIYAVGRNKERVASRLGEYYQEDCFHFIEQDVRQPFPNEIKPDIIIPLASNTHPLAYSQYPVETIEINVKGAENALCKASECGATVLYPSSVEVYGNAEGDDIFTEEYTGLLNLSNARSCYTESKRLCESLCQSYLAEKGVNVKIVRLSRVFGPTMLMNDSKASSQFILKALNGENIVLKSNGEQFFSYTYVADAVSAILYVLIHGISGIAYNIASEQCNVHLKDFAQCCARIAGSKVVFDLPSEKEKNGFSIANKAILDNTKLLSLGWKSNYSFFDSVDRTIKCMKKDKYSYSVAIRTLGKAGQMFEKMIGSLKAQTVPPQDIFVYIAEGYELPQRVADEKYIYCKKGMVHQRALPLDEIMTDYILLCDDDIEFKIDSVSKLFEALEKQDGDCISPNLFPNHEMSLKEKISHAILYGELPGIIRNKYAFRIRRNGYYTYSSNPKEVMASQSSAGACLLMKKKTFLDIRFQEETWMDKFRYPIGEDQMLAYKLYRTGHKLLVHFNAGITHLDAGSGHVTDPEKIDLDEKCLRYLIWYRSIYQPAKGFERIRAILSYYSRWTLLLALSLVSLIKGKSFRFTNCFSSLKKAKSFIASEEFSRIPEWEVIV